MHRFMRLAIAAAALTAAGGVAQAQQWETIRIGTEGAYPPFNFLDSNNELQGFDIDIAKALCAEMEVECEFVAQDWDGIIPGLLANRYDAIIASMSITEERDEVVDFTDKYYSSPIAFMAPSDSGIEDTSPEGLAGMTIGAQSATISANYLEDNYPDADIRLYPTQEEANLELANGRLDAVLVDKFVGHDWLNSEDGACCEFVGQDVTDEAYVGSGIGIAVREEDTELKEMFNKAIAAIRENGSYQEINEKYFDFSIY